MINIERLNHNWYISENDGENFLIDVEDFENLEFYFTEREDLISNIKDMLREATGNNFELMLKDINYLNELNDKYVFSSNSTNEYIAESDNEKTFNELKEELLKFVKAGLKESETEHFTLSLRNGDHINFNCEATNFIDYKAYEKHLFYSEYLIKDGYVFCRNFK